MGIEDASSARVNGNRFAPSPDVLGEGAFGFALRAAEAEAFGYDQEH
jgi:hypothetical protein